MADTQNISDEAIMMGIFNHTFVLSLLKDNIALGRSYFDKLSTNGAGDLNNG